MLAAVWHYRHFILASIKGDLRGRFARSRLGGLWFLIHPLAQAAIFSIVLAEVMQARLPTIDNAAAYPIYLLSGMAAWGLFSEILMRCLNIFIEQASVMKKIAFPRLCLPLIILGSALLNHILLLVAIMVIFLFFGHFPGLAWIYIIPGIVLISMMAFGLGVFLGILNVFSRDVAQFMSVVMQVWFWLTPIVYLKTIIPEHFRWLVDLNPMTPMVGLYQNALLLNQGPAWSSLWPALVVCALAVPLSFAIFRRASPELVDAL